MVIKLHNVLYEGLREITFTDWHKAVGLRAAPNGKRIKNLAKARLIESKRRELQDKLDSLMVDAIGRHLDADDIMERITVPASGDLDFFCFAEEWLEHATIKGKKNYASMLNSLEAHLGQRKLPFAAITYKMLKRYEESLSSKPRAQSLYLGQIRHLYREAARSYNTDHEQVIKNDPFVHIMERTRQHLFPQVVMVLS